MVRSHTNAGPIFGKALFAGSLRRLLKGESESTNVSWEQELARFELHLLLCCYNVVVCSSSIEGVVSRLL